MQLARLLKHLCTEHWTLKRKFPPRCLKAIEQAIRQSEASHGGEIRFAVEAALDLHQLLRGLSARERAIEVFSLLRVWDTEDNNGVLIYLLLADHDVEIVADRGIHRRVGAEGWETICRDMETAFREGRFETGALAGIRAVSAHLERHYPSSAGRMDQLPNEPVLL
jgi:hypothetical protein